MSPLTGVGNLWLWLPQVRVEQDLSFGAATGLHAQAGVVQTDNLDETIESEVSRTTLHADPGSDRRG